MSHTVPAARVTARSIALADGTHLLDNATLALQRGSVHAITGPSGAGKTTLLRAIAGALPPGAAATAGAVTVLGHDILTLAPEQLRRLRREHLAYLSQDPASGLNPRMKIGRLITETAADKSRTALLDLLAQVRLPTGEHLERRRTSALSGGQQRRVALARHPQVLLLDEPTAGLDAVLRDEIADLLRNLAHHHGLAIALSSHDPDFVTRCADDTVALGPATTPTPGQEASAPRTPPAAETPHAHSDGTVLTVRSLDAHVGTGPTRRQVLASLNLEVRPGALTAIVGPSGCGKTTLCAPSLGSTLPEAEPSASTAVRSPAHTAGAAATSAVASSSSRRIRSVPSTPPAPSAPPSSDPSSSTLRCPPTGERPGSRNC